MLFYPIISLVVGVVSCKQVFPEDGSGEVTCLERGQVYKEGERMPHYDPCEKPCWCGTNGVKRCRHVVCEFPACYDAIKARKECCPRCPNGANCKQGDVVLEQGSSTKQSLGGSCSSVCTCLYGGQEPTCVLQCDDVPPLEMFDTPMTSPKPMPWKHNKKKAKNDGIKWTDEKLKNIKKSRKDRRRRHRKQFSLVDSL